ncbi:Protein of unknown function [Bacillus mycoides]|uniref:Uncharacterized protein n=1 Tax=Bacillus mycoides TaxID=1405 RepID=A0A1C4G9U0_BACMY|nr:Protein of unknown function [Bacillus mycoides]SCC64683.1 Protein of unknown function [Bacillus mycoides]SCM90173.1 Protein of unknown function [Bacillus mycoides]
MFKMIAEVMMECEEEIVKSHKR